MRRKKIFYSLLVLVILASGGVWAYQNVNLGFNEERFVINDVKKGLRSIQTGNCEVFAQFGSKVACEEFLEKDAIRDFEITELTKNRDRYYVSIELISNGGGEKAFNLQLVNYEGRWVIDERQ